MLKRVCDRCGKIIESGGGQLKEVLSGNHEYDIVDLCSECFIGYRVYIHNKDMIVTEKREDNETI